MNLRSRLIEGILYFRDTIFSTISDYICPKNQFGWHSWDPNPWRHPWLSSENLRKVRQFSDVFLNSEKDILRTVEPKALHVGFCGNIANSSYVRARSLRNIGIRCGIYINDQDKYCMSFPCWEEFDGTIDSSELSIYDLQKSGIDFPVVDDVHVIAERYDDRVYRDAVNSKKFRTMDIICFRSFFSQLPLLEEMQSCDVLWGAQYPQFAYLANRPYVVSQVGGDAWFEASRQDALGKLMRRSFGRARVWLVSNPWSFAHARRYGLSNLVYLPIVLDEILYAPGHGDARARWKEQVGGDFYVLTSSRLDERNKGSSIGIEGFMQFSRIAPRARLVLIGWGADRAMIERKINDLGLTGRVVLLPTSGKVRVRDYLRSADVFLDQFVLGYYGAAGLEAMACGLPVIGRIEEAQYDALCETGKPPILNASGSHEVAAHLVRLFQEPGYRQMLASESRNWFLANHGSERWLPEYAAVLAATAMRKPANFSRSPLKRRLSRSERAYHRRGLRAAPPYPNYGW